jgi:hypothetical protein
MNDEPVQSWQIIETGATFAEIVSLVPTALRYLFQFPNASLSSLAGKKVRKRTYARVQSALPGRSIHQVLLPVLRRNSVRYANKCKSVT